jgi:hypothetical protein
MPNPVDFPSSERWYGRRNAIADGAVDIEMKLTEKR